ncbi:hypothetical protein B0T17DRAFT_484661 [Bombardia bombarda]|uniref:Uncharacterized protein n=1 Tax=Bombardia bombarda TaxID=252184 RepID=A0AA39XKH1_9PEZI|nr:hypothetical protein B0T17DRAFT_484661 [Bombardia bombarda]
MTSSTTAAHQQSAQQSRSPMTNVVPPRPIKAKTASTDVFLKDFTLVAEAAKRAQMACLMRDMEGVGLS